MAKKKWYESLWKWVCKVTKDSAEYTVKLYVRDQAEKFNRKKD